jgi:MFS family permease
VRVSVTAHPLPLTIGTLPARKAMVFLSLFFAPAAAQAILLTVVPLEALHLLGGARAVTLLYLVAGLAAVAGRFCIPMLVHLFQRRMVFTLGALLLAVSAALQAMGVVWALAVGLALATFAFACIEITSTLYLLDQVTRQELRHFEPIRIFASAGPWTLGPWLGVYLQQHVSFAAPFGITAAVALGLLALFWILRLSGGITAARRSPPNPLRYLPRFFGQKRLRLAWTLAAARSSWWSLFYLYAPIFAVTSGLGAEVGGVLVSIGTGWIWLAPVWGWLGRRYGLRALLIVAYAVTAVLSLCTALAFHSPWLGAALLVTAAFCTEMIDGAGNLLFLRAVHPYERSEMTTAFVSYRDVAQLSVPLASSVLLSVFALSSLLVAGGVMMLASAGLARHIPRRL